MTETRIIAVLIVTAACHPEPAGPLERGHDGTLINGVPTEDRPEVGRIHLSGGSACTATLIRPNVVLTAAHCVSYETAGPAERGHFYVDLSPFVSRSYAIEHIKSFGSTTGARDVALLRLRVPVPTSVATPTTLSRSPARAGEEVTIFGYGCTRRSPQEGSFSKRALSFDYSESSNLCPGDSGGPVVIGRMGPVFLVNSAFYTGSGVDVFATPHRFVDEIEAQILDWDTRFGAVEPASVVRVRNATGERLWVKCDGSESEECSGWTFLRDGESGSITTHRRGLVLDNSSFSPRVSFANRRVTAPSDEVAIYANEADPFRATTTEPTPPEGTPPPTPRCLGADGAATATLAAGATSGTVCANRDSWLLVALSAGDRLEVSVRFTHGAGDIDLELFDPSGARLTASSGTGDEERVSHAATVDGAHRLRLYGYRGASNTVRVDLAIAPRPAPPATPPDADGDGVPDSEDLCQGTSPGAQVHSAPEWRGCASGQFRDRDRAADADGDGVPDAQDRCSNTPRGARVWRSGQWIGCAGGQRPDR